MTIDPKNMADKLRQGIVPLLKSTIGDLEAHYANLRARELRKAEACQKCGDMHKSLEKCGEMTEGKPEGKPEVKKEEAKMNPAPLKDRKTVADQKAAPDAADKDSVLPSDKKSKDLTDKKTGSGGQVEKIRKAAMSETKKPKPLSKTSRDSFDWGAVVSEPLSKAKSDVRSVPMEALHGQRVHAYRNLHNGLFSLWKDGKVIAHVPEVHLDDAKLHVREGGRQRVVKEKKKNVHAFVIGTVNAKSHAAGGEPVIYNPYMHSPEEKGSFVRAADQAKVGNAAHVHMKIVDDAKGKGGKRAVMSAVGLQPLDEKPMAKAAMSVSMAKPKAATAGPASSSTSPPKMKAPKAPAAMAPATARKAEGKLAKAQATAFPQIPGRKAGMTPEDHARLAATQSAFTPASAAGEARNQGAAGGALKPSSPILAPSGLGSAPSPSADKKPPAGGGLLAPKSLIPGRKSG